MLSVGLGIDRNKQGGTAKPLNLAPHLAGLRVYGVQGLWFTGSECMGLGWLTDSQKRLFVIAFTYEGFRRESYYEV